MPPHEPLYHFHEAFVPKLPPATVNTDEAPEQISVGKAEAEVGAVERAFRATSAVLLLGVAVQFVPYVVFVATT